MSKASNGAKAIKQLAITMKGMLAAAELLEEVGSLETAVSEAKARLIVARSEEAAFKADTAKAKAANAKVRKEGQLIIDKSESASAQVTLEAKEAALDIVKKANNKAATTIANAEKTAEGALDAFKSEVKSLTTRKSTLSKQIAALELDAVSKTESADKAEAKLNSIKEQLSMLSGGLNT